MIKDSDKNITINRDLKNPTQPNVRSKAIINNHSGIEIKDITIKPKARPNNFYTALLSK